MSLLARLTENQMNNLADKLGVANSPKSDVNGLWNAILTQFFPTPKYIIKPEEPVGSGRADFVVSRPSFSLGGDGVDWYYHLIYEGRRNLGDTQEVWESLQDIIQGHASGAAPLDRQAVYCVGAVGRRVVFWHYRNGHSPELRALRQQGRDDPYDQAHLPPSYDLVNDKERIVAILEYMRDNLP